jgi:hypothetical protein
MREEKKAKKGSIVFEEGGKEKRKLASNEFQPYLKKKFE